LMNIDQIAVARVYGKKNSIMGSLICADIVLKHKQLISKKEILQKCKKDLQNYQIPAFINFLDSINTTSTGKINR